MRHKCEHSTDQPNQNQCNCDRKYNTEYNNKDINFKIEANIPQEVVDKIQGNQYHFTINFNSKTPENPAKPGREDNNEHKNQTTDIKDNSHTKPDQNVSEHPSNDNQGNHESDEIQTDMWRSNFGKE